MTKQQRLEIYPPEKEGKWAYPLYQDLLPVIMKYDNLSIKQITDVIAMCKNHINEAVQLRVFDKEQTDKVDH
jgi:hypothetical protein